MSLTAAHRQAFAALPRILDYDKPPETRQRYCGVLDTVRERQSREEWGRGTMGSTGSSCSRQHTAEMWFSCEEKRKNDSKKGQRGKGGNNSLNVYLCVGESGWIYEQRREEIECKRSVALMWQFFEAHWEKAAGLIFFSSVLHIQYASLVSLLHCVWCSSPYLKWLKGEDQVIRSGRWNWGRC